MLVRKAFVGGRVFGALRIALSGLLFGLAGCTTLEPDFETPEADVEARRLETDDTTLGADQTVNSKW